MTQAINCSSPVSHRQFIAVLPDLATMEVESNVFLTINQRPSLTLMLTTYYVFWGLLMMNFLDLDANQMQQHFIQQQQTKGLGLVNKTGSVTAGQST